MTAIMQEDPVFADDEHPEPDTLVSVTECVEVLLIPATTVWQWASRGILINGRRRKLAPAALDGKGRPLYSRRDVVEFADSRRVALASKLSGCQGESRQNYAITQSGHRNLWAGLSHVWGREGVQVSEPSTPPEIVIPVRLDLTEAEQQLATFVDHVRSSLGQAVATGLAVQSLTVALEPPADE